MYSLREVWNSVVLINENVEVRHGCLRLVSSFVCFIEDGLEPDQILVDQLDLVSVHEPRRFADLDARAVRFALDLARTEPTVSAFIG